MNSLFRMVGVTFLAFTWMLIGVLGHRCVYPWVEVGFHSLALDGVIYDSSGWGSIETQCDLPRLNGFQCWGKENTNRQTDGTDLPGLTPTTFFRAVELRASETFIPRRPWQFVGLAALHPRAPCWLR